MQTVVIAIFILLIALVGNLDIVLAQGSVIIQAFQQINNAQFNEGQILAPQDVRFAFTTSDSEAVDWLCTLSIINEDLAGAQTLNQINNATCGTGTSSSNIIYDQQTFQTNVAGTSANSFQFNVFATHSGGLVTNQTFTFAIIPGFSPQTTMQKNILANMSLDKLTEGCEDAAFPRSGFLVHSTYSIQGFLDSPIDITLPNNSNSDISISLTKNQTADQKVEVDFPVGSLTFEPTKVSLKCDFIQRSPIPGGTEIDGGSEPINLNSARLFPDPLFIKCNPTNFPDVQFKVNGIIPLKGSGSTQIVEDEHGLVTLSYLLKPGEDELIKGQLQAGNTKSILLNMYPFSAVTGCSK